MKFFKYGITLERLKKEDIELVRQWRNSDPVRMNMNYQEIISPEKQLEWFHSINNENFHYTFVPYLVSVAGIEILFYFLGWKKQYAHVLRSNTNAINYNLKLGYRLCEGQEGIDHQRYEITRESFDQTAGKIRKMVRSVAGSDTKSKILFEPEDYKIGIAQRFEDLFIRNPTPHVREETPEGVWYREPDGNQPPQG